MEESIYKSFIINNVEDVDKLVKLIKENDNFTSEDYMYLLNKAHQSKQKGRIDIRMKRYVMDLVIDTDAEILQKETKIVASCKAKHFEDELHKKKKLTAEQKKEKQERNKELRKRKKEETKQRVKAAKAASRLNRKPTPEARRLDLLAIKRCEERKLQYQKEVERQKSLRCSLIENFSLKLCSYLRERSCNKVFPLLVSSYHNFYNIKKFKTANLYTSTYSEFLQVPINEVSVRDGEVTIGLDNLSVVSQSERLESSYINECPIHVPNKTEFIEDLKHSYGTEIIESLFDELSVMYDNEMCNILKRVRECKDITFNTYVSASNFLDIYKGKKYFTFSIDNKIMPLWSIFNHVKKDLKAFIYDSFSFSEDTHNWALNIARDCGITYIENLFVDDKSDDIGRVSKFYYEENNVPHIFRNNDTVILRFVENYVHYSDFKPNLKIPDSGVVYLVWSPNYDCDVVKMFTTNEKYRDLRFVFDASEITAEKTAYVIYKYFSSNIYNKRGNEELKEILRKFSIYSYGVFYCHLD